MTGGITRWIWEAQWSPVQASTSSMVMPRVELLRKRVGKGADAIGNEVGVFGDDDAFTRGDQKPKSVFQERRQFSPE